MGENVTFTSNQNNIYIILINYLEYFRVDLSFLNVEINLN